MPNCPTCAAALASRPSRKTKCKACGAAIIVKHDDNDDVILLSELQAEAFEAARKAARKAERDAEREEDRYFNRLMTLCDHHALTIPPDSGMMDRDQLRAALISLTDKLVNDADLAGEDIRRLLYERAIVRYDLGEDFLPGLIRKARLDLAAMKRGGITHVEPTPCACGPCRSVAPTRALPIDIAIMAPPLPFGGCARPLHAQRKDGAGFCRCAWLASDPNSA